MNPARLLLAAALLAASTPITFAQVAAPILSGYQRIALLGNSDSIISLPFARPEAAAGLVASATGAEITFAGDPAWEAGDFVRAGAQTDTFYALVQTGAKEGAAFFITSNTESAITVDLDGETLAALAAGDRVAIIPCWTLATLFPSGAGIHPTVTMGVRPTEVLIPDFNATGTNASAASTYYYSGGTWLKVGTGATAHDHDILLPDALLTVRHNVNLATELVCTGQVVPCDLAIVLGVNASRKRDNYLGLQRPASVSLADAGLISSGAFAASPTPGSRTDELYVYDNTVARKNRSAAAIYYFWNNAWRKVGAGNAVFDTATVFQPGTGFVIRKSLSATAPIWTNAPNY